MCTCFNWVNWYWWDPFLSISSNVTKYLEICWHNRSVSRICAMRNGPDDLNIETFELASLSDICIARRANAFERSMWLGWLALLVWLKGAVGLLDVCGKGAKFTDSVPILSVQVRNSTIDPADESFRQTVCANTSTSTVIISYSTQVGLSVTAAFDFRKVR